MESAALYELLERLSNLLRAEERRAGAAQNLLPAQLSALAYLTRCNRYSDTPAAVTEFLGVTKGTASQTLAALVRRRLVEKVADARDRRVIHLAVTPEGRGLVKDLLPTRDFERAVASLSSRDLATMEGTLRELLTALLRIRGGRSFGVCHSCRHFLKVEGGFRCGLTGESLDQTESDEICREHERREGAGVLGEARP